MTTRIATPTKIPTVHLNGSDGQELVDGFTRAAQALANALRAMHDAAPNGRDFYVQGNDAFAAATREHEERYRAVIDVANAYERMALAVSEQVAERDRIRGRRA